MFTGIIEELGRVMEMEREGSNLHIAIKAKMSNELKTDQSIAHNGTCLTVVKKFDNYYWVTAIRETLTRTNLNQLCVGDTINLERGMRLDERLDGHIVQGHIDQIGRCSKLEDQDGSTLFHFEFDQQKTGTTIPKGSITINGVSLTVVESQAGYFSVAIIPYTMKHTTFRNLQKGDPVNLEFDVIGKYVQSLMKN